ncbi:VOC family protein [Polaribacter sp.]|uniref:VOC family protein n=1 Tax=Polaribacter sp. TaxID=1920175 RepID=UPI003EF08CFE
MKCDMYLSFDGNCKEAMLFYKDVFDGEFTVTMRYSEGPPEYSNPKIADKIMHQTMVFGTNCELKASDSFHEPLNKGNNFHISILADDEESALSYFKGLAKNGQVTMPFDDVFWGGKFGSCIDKFGVQWMISFEAENS